MWLTFGTFVGYAVIYTVILKPTTPQNIVIGGASGAMPPVLGWAAVTGDVTPPLLLFADHLRMDAAALLGAGALRTKEYAKAGVPMLPVTHGGKFTRLHLLLYTVILAVTTVLPFASGMSGVFCLVCALALDAVFLAYAVALYRSYSDHLARKTFTYSIFYLSMLFAVLLIDHYLPLFIGA